MPHHADRSERCVREVVVRIALTLNVDILFHVIDGPFSVAVVMDRQ